MFEFTAAFRLHTDDPKEAEAFRRKVAGIMKKAVNGIPFAIEGAMSGMKRTAGVHAPRRTVSPIVGLNGQPLTEEQVAQLLPTRAGHG